MSTLDHPKADLLRGVAKRIQDKTEDWEAIALTEEEEGAIEWAVNLLNGSDPNLIVTSR